MPVKGFYFIARCTILSARVSELSLVQGIVDRFRDQHTITVATGVTCAFLGDERNLREFLVADEVVKALKANGHVVHFFCFNDDMDPLTYRQLRVAVNKDSELVSKHEPDCGKSISLIKSPFSQDVSWSQYFADKFSNRLNSLGCNPNIVSVSRLYDMGLYAPYVKKVFVHQDEIQAFIETEFPGYHPEKLFWAVCPTCGYTDATKVGRLEDERVTIQCDRCCTKANVQLNELKGKLNWKLDCAARWAEFGVDAEPFTKAYLEPNAGSFHVAKRIGQRFFGTKDVVPITCGVVTMPTSLGGKILESLPVSVIRNVFVRQAKSDLDISEERIVTEANKLEVIPETTFSELVRQLLPAWLLDSSELTAEHRELLVKGLAYARNFEHRDVRSHLPHRQDFEDVPIDILKQIQTIIQHVVLLRKSFGLPYEDFIGPAKATIERLGDKRRQVTRHFRRIIGQEQGVPNSRFLYLLPISYLMNLESMIDLFISATDQEKVFAMVQVTEKDELPELRIVAGDR